MLKEEKYQALRQFLPNLTTDLSEEQLDFILHPISTPCYLKACPGGGKTEVVGLKAAYDIIQWKQIFSGIAILSFTRNAAKEIAHRIKKYGGASATEHPHYIGTVDSWIHSYLLHPFAHKATGYKGATGDRSYRLVDNEENYDYLSSFQTIVLNNGRVTNIIPINSYYFECGNSLRMQSQSRYLKLESASEETINHLQKNKKKFLSAGLTTYADAEFLCYFLLKKNENLLELFVKRFPFIIIDECQDLSHNQLEILQLFAQKGAVIHFIGDNNQSIYEFKKVYTEKIDEFISKNNLQERKLSLNYRSNQHIVNICLGLEKINTGKEISLIEGKENLLFQENCFIWEYEQSEMTNLPQKFIDFLKRKNDELSPDSKKICLEKSAVLARAHSVLSEFRPQSNSEYSKVQLIANAINTWNIQPRTGKDMQASLQQLGKALCLLLFKGKGNHQHQYCPEGMSQIEWRNFLHKVISEASDARYGIFPFESLTWSQWVAKFKGFLESIWPCFSFAEIEFSEVKGSLRAPTGSASSRVSDGLKQNKSSLTEQIRFTTIHDVKGETLDAVLVVSSSENKGTKTGRYYEDWIGNSSDKEHVRFAYVASSRPKHILIWAIPKIKNNSHLPALQKLGFVIASDGSLFSN